MSTAALLDTERTRLYRHQGIIHTIQQTMPAVASDTDLGEVLGIILGQCAEKLGYLYPSLALLHVTGDMLVGQVFSSPATWDRLHETEQCVGLPIDTILGRRGDRRTSDRRSTSLEGVPRDAIAYGPDAIQHPVARTFLNHTPYVTTCFHDVVRPHIHVQVAEAAQDALGIHSIALLPLCAAEHCSGVLVVASAQTQPFTCEDMEELKILAAHLTMAIENVRLRQDLHDREQQVGHLLKATIDAQEEERERICLEIHDGVAQTLSAALHYLEALNARPDLRGDARALAQKAAALIKDSSRGARDFIRTLRPPALDALGLVAALRFEMDELQAATGWLVDFDADQVRFPKSIETALYRILHEAVNNATRHAQATRVAVRVKHEEGRILAEVWDDGVGFDVFALERQPHRRGAGLLSMRKRAELLNGSFHLTSGPGKGTRVRIEVPVFGGQDRHEACVA